MKKLIGHVLALPLYCAAIVCAPFMYAIDCLLTVLLRDEHPAVSDSATIAALGADELNDWLAQVGGYPYPEHFGRVATVLFSDDPKSPRRKFGAGYRFDNAVDAAKGARFEHGEHGDAA